MVALLARLILITSSAFAGGLVVNGGNTVLNGGQIAQNQMTAAWSSMSDMLQVCLPPFSDCGLSPAQQRALADGVALHDRCFPNIEYGVLPANQLVQSAVCGRKPVMNAAALATGPVDMPLPQERVLTLAVQAHCLVTQSCGGGIQDLVLKSVFSKPFAKRLDLNAVLLVSRETSTDSLTLSQMGNRTDVTAVLTSRVCAGISALRFLEFSVSSQNGRARAQGRFTAICGAVRTERQFVLDLAVTRTGWSALPQTSIVF